MAKFPKVFEKINEKVEILETLAKEKGVPFVRNGAWFLYRDIRDMLTYLESLEEDSTGFNVTLTDYHKRIRLPRAVYLKVHRYIFYILLNVSKEDLTSPRTRTGK